MCTRVRIDDRLDPVSVRPDPGDIAMYMSPDLSSRQAYTLVRRTLISWGAINQPADGRLVCGCGATVTMPMLLPTRLAAPTIHLIAPRGIRSAETFGTAALSLVAESEE